MRLAPGESVDHYNVLELLGAGGGGAVYRAYDNFTGRECALKILTVENSEQQTRLIREVRAQARLAHPNICALFHTFPWNGCAVVAMEYLSGGSLRTRLAHKPVEVTAAVGYLKTVLGALDHAHEYGVIHRDLKPDNLAFDGNGNLKLLDFGIARLDGSHTLTEPGGVLGTAKYVSPEQLRGQKADVRSDVFAAGLVGYEMLTGRNPFDADQIDVIMFKILNEEPVAVHVLNADTPMYVSQAIMRALHKDPAMRVQSAAEFLVALNSPVIPEAAAKRSSLWMSIAAVATLLCVTLAALVFFREQMTNGRDRPSEAVFKISPEYTPEAMAARLEGIVVLEAVVREDGIPQDIRITKPLGLGLEQSAVEALRRWRFRPARSGGKPVPTLLETSFEFRIKNRK